MRRRFDVKDPALRESFLRDEVARFFQEADPGALRTHPLFGPLDHDDWSRAHYKHAHHHLLQFGLIEEPEPPPRRA